MGETLSKDPRMRVIAAVNGGLSRHAAAECFGIAVATAVRWLRVWHDTGATAAKPKGGDLRSHRIEAYRDVILGATEAAVDITLVELSELLKREHGASFAPGTIWRFLDRHGITIKKTAHASEQDRPRGPPAWPAGIALADSQLYRDHGKALPTPRAERDA
jgi:transposase